MSNTNNTQTHVTKKTLGKFGYNINKELNKSVAIEHNHTLKTMTKSSNFFDTEKKHLHISSSVSTSLIFNFQKMPPNQF